jgi:hypothetical protein
MTYLIDNGYATAPVKFCLWYLDFAARTVDNNYRFPLWDSKAKVRGNSV